MCQQHGYKNLISYNKRKENNKGIVEHKNNRLCQKGSLAKKMKKDKNILFAFHKRSAICQIYGCFIWFSSRTMAGI